MQVNLTHYDVVLKVWSRRATITLFITQTTSCWILSSLPSLGSKSAIWWWRALVVLESDAGPILLRSHNHVINVIIIFLIPFSIFCFVQSLRSLLLTTERFFGSERSYLQLLLSFNHGRQSTLLELLKRVILSNPTRSTIDWSFSEPT